VPILADVVVQDVQSGSGGAFSSGASQNVVVRVPAALAGRLVTALTIDGAVIRAGILSGTPVADANADLSPLGPCLGKTS